MKWEIKKRLEQIHAGRSWVKLESAEVFSGESEQMEQARTQLMLLMELQNILLLL
jgi:hypothetical protein